MISSDLVLPRGRLPHLAKLVSIYLPSCPAHLSSSHFFQLLPTSLPSSSATAICTSRNYCRLLLHTHLDNSTLCSHLIELCLHLPQIQAHCKTFFKPSLALTRHTQCFTHNGLLQNPDLRVPPAVRCHQEHSDLSESPLLIFPLGTHLLITAVRDHLLRS